ncbi:MAG: DUF350 domain-containing protein [Alphaproteobacteria bacterium]|nr:DUF350 domain-containing protein [Alphaproteobacteria bacterium]
MDFQSYFAISADPYYYAALVVDFILLFAMLVLVRKIFGRAAGGVNTADELAEKDNHAFGISLAGATVALAVIFSGVASGDIATSLVTEAAFIFGYGVLGIAMLMCTRLIFDRIVFPKIDLKLMISNGNIAAGILDAGNMIATAAVIFGVFSWSGDDWLTTLGLVVGMFVVTQLLLVCVSRYRVSLFTKRNEGRFFRDAISDGNGALAIRFAGFQIGAALAMSTAGKLVIFQEGSVAILWVAAWVIVAVVLLGAVILLTTLIEKVILYGVPVEREVDREANYGVAAVEAGAYIGLGLLLVSLLG